MRLDVNARLGVELVIVLVGVLLAFQFGGLRERRAETEGKGTQLRALQADFAANRQRLAESHGEIDAGASWGQSGHVDPEVAEALPLTSTE